jgi:Integrase core domain
VSTDRGPAWAGTVDGVTGGGPQRRPTPLSGPGRRHRCLPAGPAAQAGQAGGPAAAAGGGGQAGAAVVAAADRRVAAVGLPQDPVLRVSHETTYLSLLVQSRGPLRRELQRCLRTGRAMRSPRGKRLPQGRGQLGEVVLISERPAEAEDRAVPGHWEGDLLVGRRPSAVVTLVERASRYLTLVALPEGYKAEQVRPALAAAVTGLPEQLRRSLTGDQGKEMAEPTKFTVDTGVPVSFCDPPALVAWQRREHQRPAPPLPPQERRPGPAGPGRPGRHRRRAEWSPSTTLGFRTPSQALAEAWHVHPTGSGAASGGSSGVWATTPRHSDCTWCLRPSME